MSIIEDTIRWAEAHGFDVPGFEPDGQTTIEATIREIQAAEAALVRQMGDIIRTNVMGLITNTDRVRYDNARRELYASQLDLYQQLTSSRVVALLRSLGGGAPIPRPMLGPPIEMFLSLPTAGGTGMQGLGNPAAPVVGIGWGAMVAVIVAVGLVVAITTTAISSAYEARINSQSHSRDLDTRMRVYQECVTGGETAVNCARVAQGLVPLTPPGSTTPAWIKSLKTAAKYTAVVAVVGGLGYVGFQYLGARAVFRGKNPKSLNGWRTGGGGMRGLGSIGGPRQLRGGFDDPYPSRYFLEID